MPVDAWASTRWIPRAARSSHIVPTNAFPCAVRSRCSRSRRSSRGSTAEGTSGPRIPITRADLPAYAPIARKHVARGSMSLGRCVFRGARLERQLRRQPRPRDLGGPRPVTRFARALGDPLTRLDRNEPSLNTALPGDPRDTTTPRSMVRDWRTLLLGTALAPRSRRLLVAGLIDCRTGTARIRAGLPPGWRAGDKTGSGENGTSNDVAILFPPKRAPIWSPLI